MGNSSNQPLKNLLRYILLFFSFIQLLQSVQWAKHKFSFLSFFFLLGTVKDVKMILKLIYIIGELTSNFSSKILSLKLSQSEPWWELFSLCVCVQICFSCVLLFATLWPGFFRSGLPCPSPGDLPDPGIEPLSLASTCFGRWVLYHQHHPGRCQNPVHLGQQRQGADPSDTQHSC